MQVIIYDIKTTKYLRRKNSYGNVTWTDNLQEAEVFSAGGAKASIKAMYLYPNDLKLTKQDKINNRLVTQQVLLVLSNDC